MINYVIHSKECKDKRSNKHYHSVIILKNDIHLMIGTPFTEGEVLEAVIFYILQ